MTIVVTIFEQRGFTVRDINNMTEIRLLGTRGPSNRYPGPKLPKQNVNKFVWSNSQFTAIFETKNSIRRDGSYLRGAIKTVNWRRYLHTRADFWGDDRLKWGKPVQCRPEKQ